MRQVLNLLKKDLFFVPSIITANIIDVFYFAFAIVIADRLTNLRLNVFAALCAVTVALLIFSNLDHDERCGAERIFGTAPVAPRQIVVSKFLFSFIIVAVCIVLFSAANYVCRLFSADITAIYSTATQFCGLLGAAVLMFCFLIPIYCSGLFRNNGSLTSVIFAVIYIFGAAASLLGMSNAATVITGGVVTAESAARAAEAGIKMPLVIYNGIILASVFSLSLIFIWVSSQLSFSNYELKGYWVSVSDSSWTKGFAAYYSKTNPPQKTSEKKEEVK